MNFNWFFAGVVVAGICTLIYMFSKWVGDVDICPKCGAETFFWDMDTLVCRNTECNWKG